MVCQSVTEDHWVINNLMLICSVNFLATLYTKGTQNEQSKSVT